MSSIEHTPVLLNEVLEALSPVDGETYVDATFGRGGYTRAVLDAAECKVVAFDCDHTAKAHADVFASKYASRFKFIHARFSQMREKLTAEGIDAVNGIMADLGVSSPQLDEAERGFSFMNDGPLDMRMDQRSPLTAADVVNTYGEEELIRIFKEYGEEPRARAATQAIITRRNETRFSRTKDLANVIASVIRKGKSKIHPATRIFQAIRIEVNRELLEIQDLLKQSLDCLEENGRLVCVSFHSLEDRLVKQFMRANSAPKERVNKYRPAETNGEYPLELVTHKSVRPSETEQRINPRARSAKLRAARRTSCGREFEQ